MEDLKKLMPHHKTESKMERSKNLYVVNEISEMKNCNKCILFEGRKMRDLYVWFSNIPNGPSAKFLVENSKFFKNNIVERCSFKLGQNLIKTTHYYFSLHYGRA